LLTSEAISGDFSAALPAAIAVELVHNFTLVHGEVQAGRIDAQDRPSIWWVWGPAQAINAGDGLHALGRAAIMKLSQRGIAAERVLKAVEMLDRTCLTLCEGQYMDLSFQDQLLVTRLDYFTMIERKSGSLAGCAAGLGALAAGADDAVSEKYRRLGVRLGMAWQIRQDVDDLWGKRGDGWTASNALGKKKSLPLIDAIERVSSADKRELTNIYMKRVLETEDAARIIAILDGVEARQRAERQAAELVREAFAVLTSLGLSQEQQQVFREVADWA
jgi:geranylgeranyl diphosphate synthase type I